MSSTKRNAICDAALALFAEKGVEATTTREIAERAGSAEGTIYRHFDGKEALVERLFDISAKRFFTVLQASAEDATTPQARLRALVRGVFDFAEEAPTAFTFLLTVHHTGILEHRSGTPPPMRLFVETLRKGVEIGTFRPLAPVLATGWIVAMAQRAVVFLESEVVSETREGVIQQTVDAVLRIVATDRDS